MNVPNVHCTIIMHNFRQILSIKCIFRIIKSINTEDPLQKQLKGKIIRKIDSFSTFCPSLRPKPNPTCFFHKFFSQHLFIWIETVLEIFSQICETLKWKYFDVDYDGWCLCLYCKSHFQLLFSYRYLVTK